MYQKDAFEKAIKGFCEGLGWKLSECKDDFARLDFTMDSERSQAIFIWDYEDVIEFSVPSVAALRSDPGLPGQLSALLLEKNRKLKTGCWCYDSDEDSTAVTIMANVRSDKLDQDYFGDVVNSLLDQCDAFDGCVWEIAEAAGEVDGEGTLGDIYDVLMDKAKGGLSEKAIEVFGAWLEE
jgi:hypothetical protein